MQIVTHSVMQESFERYGLKELARKIAPDVPLDKVSYPVLATRIVFELLHQIELRDKYYFNSLIQLGITEPQAKQTIEDVLANLPEKKVIENTPWLSDEEAKLVDRYI